jgi:hypothetical protein
MSFFMISAKFFAGLAGLLSVQELRTAAGRPSVKRDVQVEYLAAWSVPCSERECRAEEKVSIFRAPRKIRFPDAALV